MSAVTWSAIAEPVDGSLRAAVRPDSSGRRAHLSVVPPIAASPVGASRPLVLTSRGRVILGAALLFLAVLVATMALGRLTAVTPTAIPRTGPVITVQAGQTLSEIAAVRLPEMSVPDGVAALQIANNLSSSAINAGTRLVIPKF